jgi:hypothetical protein
MAVTCIQLTSIVEDGDIVNGSGLLGERRGGGANGEGKSGNGRRSHCESD